MNIRCKTAVKKFFFFFKRLFIPSIKSQIDRKKLTPVSSKFGFNLGTPIDRVYTEDFLRKKSHFIQGIVCEIAENIYTKKFGSNIIKSEILHIDRGCPNVTIVGDLTLHDTIPQNYLDCFIVTVTLNFIYDYKKAILGIYKMLRKGGVALVSVAGLIQVSRYDYDRWGDYWRFTDMGIKKDFEKIFGSKNVHCFTYGNVLTAMAELQGIPAEKFSDTEIFYHDPDYQVLITIVAIKE